MDDTPHFDYPFRFSAAGHAETVDQDSGDDYFAQAMAVLKTPLGFRIELLDYGISDQVLTENGPNLREIQDVLNQWIPDFDYVVTSDDSDLENLIGRAIVSPEEDSNNA